MEGDAFDLRRNAGGQEGGHGAPARNGSPRLHPQTSAFSGPSIGRTPRAFLRRLEARDCLAEKPSLDLFANDVVELDAALGANGREVIAKAGRHLDSHFDVVFRALRQFHLHRRACIRALRLKIEPKPPNRQIRFKQPDNPYSVRIFFNE